MNKLYPSFGILAVVVYITAVIVGGALLPGYDHVYNTVSELTASSIPPILSVQILFLVYNISLLLFGWGLCSNPQIGSRGHIAATMLMAIAFLGVMMHFYPQDPRNVAMTFNGKMHLVLAGLVSPLTMLAMVLFGIGHRNETGTNKLYTYSLVSCGVTFITGACAAISVAGNSSYGGLLERLTIGSFLQWLLAISIVLLVVQKQSMASQHRITFR